MNSYHHPVLLSESIAALALKEDSVCVDATFGGGGHSRAILQALGPKGRLIAFDQDSDALANVPNDERITLVRGNYRFVHNYCKAAGYRQVDCILADLGVSSHQFDTAERGFSFRFANIPLDMRMNTQASLTAAEVLNTYNATDLAGVLFNYGEVQQSRRIAQAICSEREKSPIITTTQLEEAIEPLLPQKATSKTLARIYQALRIEVNGELKALEQFLEQSAKLLKSGGRIAIITYHSLEDRIVKNFLRSNAQTQDSMACITTGGERMFEDVFRKPVVPTLEEIERNPRARSAKLRACIKK